MPLAKGNRADLCMTMIVKDGGKSLDACLSSFRPYVRHIVIGVDDRTTDKTAKIAKKHGAEVHYFPMCDTHTCRDHGSVQAQHFARARNFVMSKVDPNEFAFASWVDADDEIVRADLLPELCAKTPAGAIGMWAEYIYAYSKRPDGGIVPNTAFHRERIFRLKVDSHPVKWDWKYRVHEVCAPEMAEGYQARWILNNDVKWLHQDGAHKSEHSAPRNLLLLEIDYEEKPDDSRTVFYLGNQYFAMGRWAEAAFWYEKLQEVGQNQYENWQAQLYACKAYQRMGALDHALRSAYGSLEAAPQHHEGYYALAEVYALMGEDDKVIHWTKVVRALDSAGVVTNPPFFVFRNPMDGSFNSRMPIADALVRKGQIAQAREELEAAYSVMPDERLGQAIAGHRKTESDMETANAFVRLAEATRDPATILRLYEKLPQGVKAFGRTRDLVMPLMMRERAS